MKQQPDVLGTLYLIPAMLHSEAINTIPPYVTETIRSTFHFFVENERSARRFFKALDKHISIDERQFSLINKHERADVALLNAWLKKGLAVGLVSEAGYPCIADPGHALVRQAHAIKARVVPLSGPNAMLMALSASGFNGQNFRFSGYLPRTSEARIRALRALEKQVQQYGETQLFMEAPYRNEKLLDDLLKHLHPDTELCIAADLTSSTEFIETRSLRGWKKNRPDLHKRPAVFLLGR